MSRRVVIVGGGVIGLCSAYYAAARGWRVTVVERGGPERDGCSYGNAGMVCPSHFVPLAAPGMVAMGLRWMLRPESPFYVKPRLSWDLLRWGWRFCRAATPLRVRRAAPLLRDLHLASRECYVELARTLPDDFGFTPCGLFMLCKTAHGLAEEARGAEYARRLGIPAEVLDSRQVAAREPDIRLDVAGGVFYPLDCRLDPGRLMEALQRDLERRGVEFLWQTEARGWRTHTDRVAALTTSRGEVAGDAFVLAGGSWSPLLARQLHLDLPMQAGKGYSLTLPRPRQMPRSGMICVEARLAVTPLEGAIRFGGTMELAGLDPAINPARVRGLLRSIPAHFPDFRGEDFDGVRPWCGLRPCAPDGLPYLGRPARWGNLIVAAGHAMMGMSLGPITGRIVGEILDGEPLRWDVRLCAPDRFGNRPV